MASQQNGFRPGSKTNWRERLASVTHYVDDLESCLDQANSALTLRPHAPSFSENKAMDNGHKDVIWKVIDKLSALDDFFSLYWVAYDKVGIQKNAIEGLSFIIDNCIGELKEIAK
jgi:hypothetical protein